MNHSDVDLTEASSVYSISNTPLFLVRKLQNDQIVRDLANRYSGGEIVQALRESAATDPQNIQEAVRPYVYMVALWYKPEMDHLLEAEKILAPHHAWFAYIASALITTFSPVQKQLITVPGQLISPTIFTSSPSDTEMIVIPYIK